MSSPSAVVAVFDLDRTLTRAGTFTPFLLHCVPGGIRLGTQVLRGLRAAFGYAFGQSTRGSLKARMLDLTIAGASRAQVRAWSDAFVARWMLAKLRPGALATLARHRAAGDHLVLATASFDFYAAIFAERLGFDHTIATTSVWDKEGQLCAALEGENCYGAVKFAAVKAYVGALPAPAHVVAYSDHHTDIDLLRWAHEGVAVNPSGGLRRLAEVHNLRVVDWNRA